MSAGRLSLRRHPTLLAATVGGAALEVAVLQLAGWEAATAIAPQVTAPPPFGVLHDLRWLLVFHQSWWAFAAGAMVMLAVRGALIAVLLRAAWPQHDGAPSFTTCLRRGIAFTAAAAVLLSPWAALQFGMAVAPISWLFFVAVPAVLVTALLVHHGPAAGGWWRHAPRLRTMAWTASTFVVLTAAGTAIGLAPAPLVVPAAAAGGLWNAWSWYGITHAVASGPRSTRVVPLAPAGVVAFVALVAAGVAVGFEVNAERSDVRQAVGPGQPSRGRPVLVVAGFGSEWTGEPQNQLPGAVNEHRYSYRGMAGGEPLPYGPQDTHRDLAELVAAMDQQVRALAGGSTTVAIVAASEGSVVAQAYLASHDGAPVDALVVLSPLVDPGRVWYPPPGSEGWGLVAGWELRGVTAVLRGLSPVTITPDAPLLRSLVELAPALRQAAGCSPAGVRQLAVVPLADAVVAGPPRRADMDRVVVPAFHGGLLGDDDVSELVVAFLEGRPVGRTSTWDVGERAIRAGASAWQVPSLPASLHPAWRDAGPPTCASARRTLVRALGGGDDSDERGS